MLWVGAQKNRLNETVPSKELPQCDGSFEPPKHKPRVMDKKIFTILRQFLFMFILTCDFHFQVS